MIALAALLRDAAGACSPEGRPLYARTRGSAWPNAPHLVMWHARRCCASTAATVTSGRLPVRTERHRGTGDPLRYREGIRSGVRPGQPRWSQDEWDSAVSGLVAAACSMRTGN